MKQKKRGMAAMVLAVFLFGFFVFGLNILRVINQRRWVAHTPVRVLLIKDQGKQMEVLTIWPNLQNPVIIRIPSEVYIPAVGGYGNLQPEALLSLGQVDGVGTKLLVDSIGFALEGPIHEVIEVSGDKFPGFNLKRKLIGQGLTGKRSLIEAIEISRLLDMATTSNIRTVELSQDNAIRDRIEVDGSTQKYLEPALLHSLLSREVLTMWPEAAGVQVAIINSSNMSQMATVWSRYAWMSGFDVVSVTDIPAQSKITRLIFESKQLMRSQAGKALITLYPQAKAEVGETAIYRADVALVVGLDSWQWLNQRGAYLSKN